MTMTTEGAGSVRRMYNPQPMTTASSCLEGPGRDVLALSSLTSNLLLVLLTTQNWKPEGRGAPGDAVTGVSLSNKEEREQQSIDLGTTVGQVVSGQH